jgi:hypothetical protein
MSTSGKARTALHAHASYHYGAVLFADVICGGPAADFFRHPAAQAPPSLVLVQLTNLILSCISEQFCPPHAAVVVTVNFCRRRPAPPAEQHQFI